MRHQVPPGALVALAPNAAEMKRLGAALAPLLRPGDTVLLGGDLGAGKTTFTQGLAAALGVAGPVTSPTFVLLHSYRTSAGWDLLHADVWRLEQLQEVIDLAIPELLEEGAVAVVEWGELAAPALAPDYLHVAIDFDPSGPEPEGGPSGDAGGAGGAGGGAGGAGGADGGRRLVFSALGPSWLGRMAELSGALAAEG
ncbi:MAG TPA: tRNA (adenosine(37)-N6)-threonylcarbamoyltransferase complex ATPase subunit type 1 TsaE [Acidimicrobiales bacterium]|nr:tRNA (adenosine(37)-N6)-threonylcarbamoyltransferase complex ATPase subunit type 1 TsaE [Acidimicrobiales bacterium]